MVSESLSNKDHKVDKENVCDDGSFLTREW